MSYTQIAGATQETTHHTCVFVVVNTEECSEGLGLVAYFAHTTARYFHLCKTFDGDTILVQSPVPLRVVFTIGGIPLYDGSSVVNVVLSAAYFLTCFADRHVPIRGNTPLVKVTERFCYVAGFTGLHGLLSRWVSWREGYQGRWVFSSSAFLQECYPGHHPL